MDPILTFLFWWLGDLVKSVKVGKLGSGIVIRFLINCNFYYRFKKKQ
jgi:hypothetical protein